MRIARVRLRAPAGSAGALAAFFGSALGLRLTVENGAVRVEVGESEIHFTESDGAPFHHLALLVPGDRWEHALAWARERVELLPDPETGEEAFEFAFWEASAAYFHDPAGSILELIAPRGVEEHGREGPFAPDELVGISEIGLVGDTGELAGALAETLGLGVWDGVAGVEGRLAFVGEKARTLILCPPGRGWLPTGRPAELHPVEVELAGLGLGAVDLPGGHRVALIG
jgi:catechol 2,3-dioxygenase-like lactoylglutathione lyase family enzyme